MPMEHENCPCMETCPLNRAMALIGGKWKMQILCSLYNNGPTRYNQLKKTLDGVSNTVLGQRPAGAGGGRTGSPAGVPGGPCPGGVRHHRAVPPAHPHFGRAGRLEHGPLGSKRPRRSLRPDR